MEQSGEKKSFLYGAAWLTAAAAVVKVIGALYKIPLSGIIGDAGFSYFNTAYEIYAVLLMVSTAGLPVAMSRMIAESESRGRYNQVRRTFRSSFLLFFLLGGAGTVLMCGFPKALAEKIGQPDAWYAILALGPSALLLCLTSAFRGFFQGQGDMRPTSISQILEALCKLVIGLGLAWFLTVSYHDVPLAAGGAILGVTIGSLLALGYMAVSYGAGIKRLPKSQDIPLSYGASAKRLLSIAVPITIGAAGLQLINLIDTAMNLHRLKEACGFSQQEADTLKGIYNFAQTVFGLPTALITPVSISVLPAIAAQMAQGKRDDARKTEESAVRVVGLIAVPCAIGLLTLAEPIMALLRGYSGQTLQTASRLLSVLGLCVLFNGTVVLTNAIMQAHGYPGLPVLNMVAGGLVKVAVNYILVGNPRINIQGAPVGTLCCYLCITVLNVFAMGRKVEGAPRVTRNLFRPLLAAVPMGLCAFLSWKALGQIVTSRLLLCGIPVALGAAVYVFLVWKLKILTYEDCLLLPKGEKIAKILKLEK